MESNTARYFYLRLIDQEGRKTWSQPVWTGRAIDEPKKDRLVPLHKVGFAALEEKSGADVSCLLNDDPTDVWFSDDTACCILIDMQEEKLVAGLGNYHRILDKMQLAADGIPMPDALSYFPYDYRLSTSLDGKTFENRAAGVFRIFSGEEIIRFAQHPARFIKLEILSTTGANSERKAYRDANIALAELTVCAEA